MTPEERIREYQKRYRTLNREKLAADKKVYFKKYYQDNKEKLLGKSKIHYRANRVRINSQRRKDRLGFRVWWISYKTTLKCERCDESTWHCLDFHHKDPSIKQNMVSKLVGRRNKKLIADEINKCIVLCSNCHRKEHYHLAEN